jgi:hypothetical protein
VPSVQLGTAVNARAEAYARLGGRYEVRVLEPSPPAVAEPPWFADDPVARGDVAPGRQLVAPVGGDLSWDALAVDDPRLAAWCADRWLAAYRRLAPAPAALASTRGALHRLAERVLSPARQRATGKLGLRYTRGGFGTPFFGDDVQLRVEADQLVVQRGERERRAPISTVAAAADTVGRDLLPRELAFDDIPLAVDATAAAFLGDWYGFGASVLEQLRAEASPELDASRVQLWPEHFDVAVELGDEARGRRAAYGASPGDELHPEPYLYVAPWSSPPPGELWNATAFAGAELPLAALLDAADQRAAALAFLRTRLAALTG